LTSIYVEIILWTIRKRQLLLGGPLVAVVGTTPYSVQSIQKSKSLEEDEVTRQCLKKGFILQGGRTEEQLKQAKIKVCFNMS